MLTGKQKRFLRSKAHHVKPLFQVGKHGVTTNLNEQLSDLLEKRELIKVSILQNCSEDKQDVATQLAEGTKAEIVQVIGNNIVLYKKSDEDPTLVLPE